jgi:hypothetical protein
MDPITIALMAAQAIPGIVGMFKKPYNETQTPTNINPFTDQVYGQMQSQYGNLNNLWNQSLGASRTAGQADFGQSRNLLSQLQNVNYDPMAANRAFMSQVPGFQNLVKSSIGDSSSEQELARMRSIAGEEAASRFGGSPTGSAFQQNVIRASMEPGFQYMQNRENLEASMLGNLLNQNMGNLNQNFMNQAQFQAGNLLSGAQGYAGLGDTMLQSELARLSGIGSQLGNTQSILGQMGQANMWSPNMINNPNYSTPGDAMQGLMNGASMIPDLNQWLGAGKSKTPTNSMPSFSTGQQSARKAKSPWKP